MSLNLSQRQIRVVLSFFLFLIPIPSALAGEASDTVAQLQETILKIMKGGERWGYKGRYDIITPAVEQTHDLPVIARIVTGRYWKKLTPEQQAKFTDTFSKLSHSTYAGRFNSYSGQQFSLISEKSMRRDRKLVQTRFVKADGEEIRFNYVLHQANDQWKIINIIIYSINFNPLKSSSFIA